MQADDGNVVEVASGLSDVGLAVADITGSMRREPRLQADQLLHRLEQFEQRPSLTSETL